MKKTPLLKTLFLLLMMAFPLLGSAQTVVTAENTTGDSVNVSLAKALEIAFTESPSIRIANRDIETKVFYRKEQLVNLFPNVAGNLSYQRTLQKQKMVMDFMGQTQEIEVGTSNMAVAGATLTMPIVNVALWQSLKLTAMDIDLAVEQSRSSRLELTNNVKKGFYAVLVARETYRVLLDNLKNVELTAKTTNDKYLQGTVSEFDKLRADVQVFNARPEVSAAKNNLDLSEKALKIYIGVDINEPLIFDGNLDLFEEEIVHYEIPHIDSLSTQLNTDLRQIDMGIAQLERSRTAVMAGSLPSLALSGNFQYMTMGNDNPPNGFNWFPYSIIGVSLQVPIVSWASTSYKMKQMKNNIMNMQDNKINLERSIRLTVTTQLNNIDKALADFQSSKASVDMAQRAYDIATKQYDVGLITFLDLNNSELALIRSQLLYNQSIYNYLVAQAELEKILGNQEPITEEGK